MSDCKLEFNFEEDLSSEVKIEPQFESAETEGSAYDESNKAVYEAIDDVNSSAKEVNEGRSKVRTANSKEKYDLRNVQKNIMNEFIETYRNHPALWQMKNRELYNNRKLKDRGYAALVRVWRQFDGETDEKTVKVKLQSIRGCFRKELRKIEKSQQAGSETYSPQLWYFHLLHFLNDDESLMEKDNNTESFNASIQADQESMEETEMEIGELNETNEDSLHSDNNKKRKAASECSSTDSPGMKKATNEQEQKVILVKCSCAQETKASESDALCRYISAKLEKVQNPEQRMYAESLLTKILNKAVMGRLTEDTDIYDRR